MSDLNSSNFWHTVDLKKSNIPDDIKEAARTVEVKDNTISVENATVFYREVMPSSDSLNSNITMLLLHGKMFSSKTWLDLGTLHLLGAMGYRTVAADIPGYGNSPAFKIKNYAEFLNSLIEALNIKNPVIVSPSLSGFFTLPFLIKYWKKMGGYIPVAPVGYDVLEKLPPLKDSKAKEIKGQVCDVLHEYLHDPLPDLTEFRTPTMVVFGEKDRSRSSALLSLLPWSRCAEIPNGRHPAYLDDPELWHKLLFNFLSHVAKLAASQA